MAQEPAISLTSVRDWTPKERERLIKQSHRQNWANHFKNHWTLYLLLVLPLAQIIIFRYGPMINIIAAFKENMFLQPVFQREWADNHGFQYFIQAFNDQYFREAFRNTLVLSILQIIIAFPVPIILAILLNELRVQKFKRVTQTILYMPHFLSWAIIGGIATQVLGERGLVNNVLEPIYNALTNLNPLLEALNLTPLTEFEAVPFLSSEPHWVITFVLIGVWQGMGWGTIIYLAAITGINPELYEAAAVDGAKRFRMIWHVTLPGIRSVIIILLVLNIGGIMSNSFERIMAMRNPVVYGWSDVLEVYTFRRGVEGFQQSLASAVGLFQSVASMILLLGANYISKRSGEQGIM